MLNCPVDLTVTDTWIATVVELKSQCGIGRRTENVLCLVDIRRWMRVGARRCKARGASGGCRSGIVCLACSPCRPAESTQLCRPLAAVGESLQALDRLARSLIRRCVGFEHRQRPLDTTKGPQTHGAQVVLRQSYRIRFAIHASTSRAAVAFGKERTASTPNATVSRAGAGDQSLCYSPNPSLPRLRTSVGWTEC